MQLQNLPFLADSYWIIIGKIKERIPKTRILQIENYGFGFL